MTASERLTDLLERARGNELSGEEIATIQFGLGLITTLGFNPENAGIVEAAERAMGVRYCETAKDLVGKIDYDAADSILKKLEANAPAKFLKHLGEIRARKREFL